jgi:hypothetical protein
MRSALSLPKHLGVDIECVTDDAHWTKDRRCTERVKESPGVCRGFQGGMSIVCANLSRSRRSSRGACVPPWERLEAAELYAHHAACRVPKKDSRVQGFAAKCAASNTPGQRKRWMTSTFDPPDMPRLHALDGEFGEDAAAVLRARRRRTSARLLMLAGVVLGLGAIGVLAFAWSNADGGLRFELQSAATPPKNAPRAAMEEEIDRLRREIDALKNELKEAAHTIAAVKLAEQEL